MVSLHPWLLLLLSLSCFSSSSSSSSNPHKIPRLRTFLPDPSVADSASSLSDDFQTYFYEQTLDHFNYNPKSYTKFNQSYVINSKYWGGAKSSSPIFAYLGAEAALTIDIPNVGFLVDTAPRFKALLVYIEHRFYGKSNPLGTMDAALANEDIRGYFNSAQALADYAEVLLYLKQKMSAHNSPIIVIGASYGGMLASWFRLKYPHIAMGALASSAPLLYFDDITPHNAYYSRVTQDFKEVSKHCYQTIRKSWSMIDEVAAEPNGLSTLSRQFKTCSPLNTSSELKTFLSSLYILAAQYDAPPEYPVTLTCRGIDSAPKGANLLDRIFAGIVNFLDFIFAGGNQSCYDITLFSQPTETTKGSLWQGCSEIVFPRGIGSNSMFPAAPFILKDYIKTCESTYGVSTRPHWITTYYGGHDIKLVLQKFGSNIIFSNGLRDPYSTGGVLEDLSGSLLAVHTKNGSHGLDLAKAQKTDPAWLVAQREIEVEIMEAWIKMYYADLAIVNQRENDS